MDSRSADEGRPNHAIEDSIGYRFTESSRLRLALTHSTYSYENRSDAPQDNERLEFLGDSVLGLYVSQSLFHRAGDLSEGVMTRLRASLVCESTLVQVARGIDLGSHLLLGRGEEGTGGRNNPSNLSNAVEALLGAVFVDGGWPALVPVADRLFAERIDRAVDGGVRFDAKSRLYEAAQEMNPPIEVAFTLLREEGPEHARRFTVLASYGSDLRAEGEGPSKKEAEQSAARSILDSLGLR